MTHIDHDPSILIPTTVLGAQSRGSWPSNDRSDQQGFTLIEIMIVVIIIAILAAIAVPSYRRYAVQNAEHQAQAKMLSLQLQLERWRASRLTYKGFIPERGDDICSAGANNHCYDIDNTGIYVPAGSTAATHKYQIRLVDSADPTKSLVASGSGVNTAIGRGWKMLATPNSSLSQARRIMLSSDGVQCLTNDSSVTIASANCGSGSQNW